MLSGLHVDVARMRENAGMTGGLIMTESVVARLSPVLGRAGAQNLVTRLATRAAEHGQPVRQALLAEPEVTRHLSESDVDSALDPASYLGSAAPFIERALATHAEQTARAVRTGHAPEQEVRAR